MKLLLAYLQFGPYHCARLEAARAYATPTGHEVIGLAMARTVSEYAWGSAVHPSLRIAGDERPLEDMPAGAWHRRLKPILAEERPTVCAVAGYSHPSMLALTGLCLACSMPVVLMSDSQTIDEPRCRWRELVKSRIVRLASTGFTAGTRHAAYLESLGMPPDRIFLGYDAIDNGFFASESARWRGTEPPSPPYFLASARFIQEKNLPRLLDAYAAYVRSSRRRSEGQPPRFGEAWPLVLLGDGDGKSALLAHAETLGLEPVERAPWEPGAGRQAGGTAKREGEAERPVLFLPGFRQIEELPRFYAGAGAFVHASIRDTWGLVVNEAMASGLPVLVSERCGCALELVREGDNGWTFDPGDVEGLAGLMARVAALPPEARSAMGEASRRIVADWGPEGFAAGLMAAAEKALEIGPRRGTVLDRALLGLLARR